MPHYLSFLLVWLTLLGQAWGFSPYEAFLASDRDTQVGLLAVIRDDQTEAFAEAVRSLEQPPLRRQLEKAGIANLTAYTRVIDGTNYAVIHFVYAGDRPYLQAAEDFELATRGVEWGKLTSPHPRATTYGRQWLQMEWINYLRGYDVEGPAKSSLMIGCQVRPEKEAEYRTLHQTVWPGVVDQNVRGKIRDLCVFLVEIDDKLVEFLYLEYLGDDQTADDAAARHDPVSLRWWKQTDACQMPFSDVSEGIWALLNPVPTTKP